MTYLNRSRSAAHWLTLACWFTTFGLGWCNYVHEHDWSLRRSDTITLGAGDAVAHNIAVHTINPWPSWARNDRISMEGNRAALAIKRYQENKSIPPPTLDTSSVSIGGGFPGSGGGSQ
jgi:hypothetical protein